jgi:hypothetical protein
MLLLLKETIPLGFVQYQSCGMDRTQPSESGSQIKRVESNNLSIVWSVDTEFEWICIGLFECIVAQTNTQLSEKSISGA